MMLLKAKNARDFVFELFVVSKTIAMRLAHERCITTAKTLPWVAALHFKGLLKFRRRAGRIIGRLLKSGAALP